jgi:hypothetical protein
MLCHWSSNIRSETFLIFTIITCYYSSTPLLIILIHRGIAMNQQYFILIDCLGMNHSSNHCDTFDTTVHFKRWFTSLPFNRLITESTVNRHWTVWSQNQQSPAKIKNSDGATDLTMVHFIAIQPFNHRINNQLPLNRSITESTINRRDQQLWWSNRPQRTQKLST